MSTPTQTPIPATSTLTQTQAPTQLFWGIIPKDCFWTMSSKNASLSEGSVAKAVAKLEEVLLATGKHLTRDQRVMDVGAAPGSWTSHLAKTVKWVIALDPGDLSAEVADLSNVLYLQKKAEDFCVETDFNNSKLSKFVSESDASTADFKVDMVVADMNIHPLAAARICLPLLRHLAPGGSLLMTMKFFGVGRDRTETVKQCKDILGDAVDTVSCIWLFANTVNERVLVATRSHAPVLHEVS
eukprot:m.194774 g.194774  ORF g.194774 m.194774 type:complete len:241 (-) comp32541_c2_seq10:111-833(-)